MVAQVPANIDKDYVVRHWTKRPWAALIEGLLDQTVAWSVTTSQLIASGEEQGGAAPIEEEPAPAMANGRAAPAPRAGRRSADDDLL